MDKIKDKALKFWLYAKDNCLVIWRVLTKPDKAWTEIVADADAEQNACKMVYFAIGVCTLAQLLGWWLVKGVAFYFAILAAVFRFCALLGSWHFVRWLVPHLPTHVANFELKIDLSARELLLLSSYGMIPIFIMLPVLSFTNVLFLYVAAFYNIVTIYNGVVKLQIPITEEQRGHLTLRMAFLLWILPIVVYRLLCFIVPNAHLWVV